jgi:hypothetical protein
LDFNEIYKTVSYFNDYAESLEKQKADLNRKSTLISANYDYLMSLDLQMIDQQTFTDTFKTIQHKIQENVDLIQNITDQLYRFKYSSSSFVRYTHEYFQIFNEWEYLTKTQTAVKDILDDITALKSIIGDTDLSEGEYLEEFQTDKSKAVQILEEIDTNVSECYSNMTSWNAQIIAQIALLTVS